MVLISGVSSIIKSAKSSLHQTKRTVGETVGEINSKIKTGVNGRNYLNPI